MARTGHDVEGNAAPDTEQRDATLLRESIQEFPGPVAVYDDTDRLIAHNALYRWVHGTAFETVEARSGGARIRYEDLVRESAKSVVPPDQLENHVADRMSAQRAADGTPIDRYYPDRGWFRIVKVRTPSGAIAGFATDVTELKEKTLALEQARAAAEAASVAKSAFLANMSHELRTPLNAVIGLAEALELGTFGPLENENHRRYMADIRESGQHLLTLISDLLDLAKVESGALELERAPFAASPLVESCCKMLRPVADAGDVSIERAEIDSDLRLDGDERKIKQALINILSNAVKFSHRGGKVVVSAGADSHGMRFVVEDAGIGLDPAELARVFEPFGRLHTRYAAPREGTGLGLPLAQRMAELHGGRIAIDSAPGKGTRVVLELPPDLVLSA